MALKGVKVLELASSSLAPGPFCGMILADFGASVIRIDKVGSSIGLDCLTNGKQVISVNIKQPEGRNIIRKLSEQSDVLLEPFRTGVMESLELGPDVLLKDNPRLIYARLTGYGQTGEYSKKAGHDINNIALSGLLSLFGRHKEKPIFPVNFAAGFAGGGLMCALGIVMALFERNSSGLGQIVDNSMVAGTSYVGSWLYRSQNLPMIWGNERGKNILDTGTHFYEVYETKDEKFISVGAIEHQFYENLLKGLNLDEVDVPQSTAFDKNKIIFAQKFKEKTLEEWMKIYKNLDACVAPVLGINEAPKHSHNVEQKTFSTSDNKNYAPNTAPILSRTPGCSRSSQAAPQEGEHTRQILRNLKFTEEEITTLEKEGVVECYYRNK